MLCIARLVIITGAGIFFSIAAANAQHGPAPKKQEKTPDVRPSYYLDHDTNYYRSFERYITVRTYFSQKYGGFQPKNPAGAAKFQYYPNTTLTAGIGVTYQSISLNIGYGFGFLNNDREKGKTRYLDLQTHIYGRQWTIDLLGQLYKGYYLNPKGLAATDLQHYYLRPDLRVNLFGIAAYRLLNPNQFSFRAALLENEQQRKSAGSWLIGAEFYYGHVKSDSSFLPWLVAGEFPARDLSGIDFFKIGPGVGYAYTYMINPNFFVTGSLCASLSIGYSNEHGNGTGSPRLDANRGFIYRLVAGYDQHNWNVNLSLVGNEMLLRGIKNENKYIFSTGNFRLTIAKRLKPGKSLRDKLHPVDKVIENVRGLTPPKQ
jgi:hypothetical protein